MTLSAPLPEGSPPIADGCPVVLHVRSSGGLFGADRVVLDLCRHLPARDFAPVLVPLVEPDGSGEALAAEAERLGITVARLPLRGVYDTRLPGALARLAGAHGASILHGHDYKSDLAVAFTRGPWRRIATLHGWVGTSWSLRVKEAVDAFLVRRFDDVICVSEALAARERRRGLRRCRVIQNGIDLAPFDAPPERGTLERLAAEFGLDAGLPVIGAIGRLSHEKGYDRLLRAVRRLADDGVEVDVLLIGDGPEEGSLRALAAELDLAERLHLPGLRDDAKGLYALLDVFCMPSRREGLPLALLEAMAAGRPSLVAPVGGIPEVIDVDPPVASVADPDEAGAWAEALKRLVLGRDAAAAMGERARQRVYQAFSADAMTSGVARAYRSMLSDDTGR